MAVGDTEYDAANAVCEAAVIEFRAASATIDARRLGRSRPTAFEFQTEDDARAKLMAARRALSALPRVRTTVEPSAPASQGTSARR
jgi:hypothetical protein